MSSFRLLRSSALLAVLLAALLLVAACAPIATPGAAPAQEPAADAEAESRTVAHALGESVIPADPQRIVALGEDWLLADLIALGVKPVASTVNVVDAVTGINAAALEGIELWTSQNVSLETLIAANPDLIIGLQYFVETAGYDVLSQIAPVVVIAPAGITEQYAATAAALGLEAQAAEDVAAYEARLAEVAAELGDAVPTVSVATIYPGASLAAWVDGPAVAVPTALVGLGVELHPGPEEVEEAGATAGRAFLSLEQLPLFDGDILILLQSSGVEGEEESIAQVQGDPLWSLLPAVQAGNVHVIDRLGAPGFTGLQSTVEQVLEILQSGG